MKLYGSLQNRIMENAKTPDEITVGMGMTEYGWSDREAYEVTQVIDQKHIYVRRLDHEAIDEGMTNNWKLTSNPNNPEYYLTRRGDAWYWTVTLTAEELANVTDQYERFRLAMAFDFDKVQAKGKQTKYERAKVSFGRADYYYDYEF